jgi:hypothetical protein
MRDLHTRHAYTGKLRRDLHPPPTTNGEAREGSPMPNESRYPDVYVEEVRSDVHQIPGVATSNDRNDQKCKNMRTIAILIVLLLGAVLAVRAVRRRRQRTHRRAK